jgi:hypothetical protein
MRRTSQPSCLHSLRYFKNAILPPFLIRRLIMAPMILKAVNAFYEPGPAPPPIPLLSSQVPLIYDPGLISMSANEEIRPPKIPKAPRRRVIVKTPEEEHSSKSSKRRARSRSVTPRRPRSPEHDHSRRDASPEAPASADDESVSVASDILGSDLTDISEHSEVSSIQETIPKPAGAAGRPESGGYNLAAAMHWSSDTFKRLQVGDQNKILHILGLMFLPLRPALGF